MNYLLLKILHITGLGLTFMGLAGVLANKMTENTTAKDRRLFHITHGLGMLLLIATGIMMGVQLKTMTDTPAMPGWVKAKFVVWLLAGAAIGLAARFGNRRFAGLILAFFTILVATAAWLAIYKPF